MMAQMSAKKGLKMFGEPGAAAILSELQQMHDYNVVEPVLAHELTREEKIRALHYRMYLCQKRCSRIKARGCADGRVQRLWKEPGPVSSPTVRTESVFISLSIDASERRYVIVCDIPGAFFMQARIDEVVHVKFEGEIAELLTKVNPLLYEKYRVYHNHKPVIYVKLNKALYGTLQAALLFWRELSDFIVQELGFTMNPFDECMANKTINGKQCTILWHVDNLKISHVDPSVVESILARLKNDARFGQQKPLSVTRGPILDYLGIRLDFSTEGQVSVTMPKFMDQL